jgi:Domain of unknown function (DUF4402)
MKHMKKSILFAILMFALTAATFAQVSATATASATIVGPIGITNSANMSFGNVAVSAALGTVVLAPAGTRTVTGGCTLPVITGTVTAAAFNVTGAANYTYAITLPGSVTITDGTNNMTVDTFTSNPTPTGTIGAGGSEALTVGATLHVAGSQVAGTYTTAAPFSVTVNYN